MEVGGRAVLPGRFNFGAYKIANPPFHRKLAMSIETFGVIKRNEYEV